MRNTSVEVERNKKLRIVSILSCREGCREVHKTLTFTGNVRSVIASHNVSRGSVELPEYRVTSIRIEGLHFLETLSRLVTTWLNYSSRCGARRWYKSSRGTLMVNSQRRGTFRASAVVGTKIKFTANGDHLAGVWKNNLFKGMLWVVTEGEQSRRHASRRSSIYIVGTTELKFSSTPQSKRFRSSINSSNALITSVGLLDYEKILRSIERGAEEPFIRIIYETKCCQCRRWGCFFGCLINENR